MSDPIDTHVNIHAAKTQLSQLVERAMRGETVVIAKAGRPMVRLVPVEAAEVRRVSRLGFLAGAVAVPPPEVFNRMAAEEVAGLFGEGE